MPTSQEASFPPSLPPCCAKYSSETEQDPPCPEEFKLRRGEKGTGRREAQSTGKEAMGWKGNEFRKDHC